MNPRTAEDILRANDIHGLENFAAGTQYTTCPQCSAKRSKGHQQNKVLGVTIDNKGVTWACNHCTWSGGEFYSSAKRKPNGQSRGNAIIAIYDYVDENGALLFQVCRTADKSFPQRRPDAKVGGWIWGTKDVRKVLYRLPELIEAIANGHTILIVEGEKDADAAWRIGLPATCNPGGASEPGKKTKWRAEYSEMLRGAHLVIIPDHDTAGYAHAEAIARMSAGIAKRVRILKLAEHWPEVAARKGGDLSDGLAAGHTREQLDALIENTRDFEEDPNRPGTPEDGGHHADIASDGPIVSSTDHMARARAICAACHPHLRHWRDDFWDHEGGVYRELKDGTIEAKIWKWLDRARTRLRVGKQTITVPFLPKKGSVAETLAALKAVTHVDPMLSMPCWLDGRTDPPPTELVAFPNGLLDLRTNRLLPPDPAFFSTAVLGFDYQPAAPTPDAWLIFLEEIFNKEKEQINALQEVFGYLIATDVSMEKACLLLGPARSGKGTMLAMLRTLIAASSISGPSLQSLGGSFGLMPLIGKQLAIIDDLRPGSAKEQAVLIENLLKITGRGFFTIDRKYKDAWSGTLPVKLVLVSNVMPKLGDDSAAVAGRFLIFNTRRSFYGKEDPRLFVDKLEREKLGVLHWALTGLQRLRKRGYFTEPKASREARERMANLGSPVRAFVAERCIFNANAHVEKDVIYEAWCVWAGKNNTHPMTKERFCEALYSAHSEIRPSRPRDKNGQQLKACSGIRLKTTQDEIQAKERTEAAERLL